MKHEWRKKEKKLYIPKTKPEEVVVPKFKFITIQGAGNPNSPDFGDFIGALYSVAYAIKMNLKKEKAPPQGYQDWTVYPLEGVWDITDEAKKSFTGQINKDDLVFELMIRQPEFVDNTYFDAMKRIASDKTQNLLLNKVEFKSIKEGRCIQMMHLGSYDKESESFEEMELFAQSKGLKRKSKIHREIYLSDFRKVPVDKLKTTLRFQLED